MTMTIRRPSRREPEEGKMMSSKNVSGLILALAWVLLLCAAVTSQVPPQDQRSLPQAPPVRQLGLELDFNIEAGASTTKSRSVALNFTARERNTSGNLGFNDVTGRVTHYRALEDNTPDRLSTQPWIPITRRAPSLQLAEHDAHGQRYGTRTVVFQVKTDTLVSNISSDSIVLEPVLKDYRVSASGSAQPLIQYAAQQGFTFPLNYYETCKGSCPGNMGADPNLASGTARVGADALVNGGDNTVVCVIVSAVSLGTLTCSPRLASAPTPAGTCTTKADYYLFEGRELNQFWRIKSVNVSGASVHNHGVNRFLLKFNFENKDASCFAGFEISIGDVVVEGPAEDDFVDTANPWKNAFVRRDRLLLQPNISRPD